MSDANISVVISAQTADLSAKLALAQSSLRQFSAETKAAADEFRKAGDAADAGLRAKVEQAAASMASTQSQVRALKSAMEGSAQATREHGAAHAELSLATSGTTREFIVLGHEAMQGNFNKIPGSMVVLLERMGSLHSIVEGVTGKMVALGAVALGVAGTFAYFSIEAMKAAGAAQQALGAAAFFGNVDITKEQIGKIVAEIHKLPGATFEDAEKVAHALASLKDGTGPLMQALTDQIQNYAKATGEDLPAAANKLKEAFAEPMKTGGEFLQHLNAGRETLKQFEEAASQGDRVRVLTLMLTELAAATIRHEQVTHAATQAERTRAQVGIGLESALSSAGGAEINLTAQTEKLNAATKAIDTARIAKIAQDLDAALGSAKAQNLPTGAPLARVREQAAAMKTNTEQTNAQILAAEVKLWQDRLEVGDLKGRDLVEAEKARDDARSAFARAAGEQAINEARLANARLAAEGTLGKQQLLQAEAAGWARVLASGKLTAEQRLQVERDYQLAVAQIVGNGKVEHLAALRAVTDEARKGSETRIAAARAEVAYATATYKDGSVQAIEAQKRLDLAIRDARDQSVALTRSIADTNAQVQKLQGTAAVGFIQKGVETRSFFSMLFGDSVDAQFQAEFHQLTASAQGQIAQFRAAFQQMVPAGNFDAAMGALAGFNVELGNTADLMRQIGAGDDVNANEVIANLNRARIAQQQYASEVSNLQAQAARKTQQEWVQGLQPVTGAMSGFLTAGVLGTATFRQATLNALNSIVSGYINMGTQALAQWVGAQLGMTAATTAGTVARTGVTAGGAVAAGAVKAGEVAGHVTAETAKTVATEVGVTTRTAAEEAGALEGLAISASTAIKDIAIKAYQAAAGAYAAISAIPYVGPFLAPVVAAGTLAAVIALGRSIASAEGGWERVPADGVVTQLHKDEMVLPASIANPVRAMATASASPAPAMLAALGGAAGGGAPSTFAPEIHVHATDAKSFERMLRNGKNVILDALRDAHRNFDPRFRPA